MNISLIFAGGSGVRMNTGAKPKQFLKLHEKEIIIHTIENFEKHPDIDAIIIVCIDTWIPYLNDLIDRLGIKKVKFIVPGGNTGQESIYHGLSKINENFPEDSIILIHDGVRPLIEEDLISRCIQSVKEHESAITVVPAIETIVSLDDSKIKTITDRSKCFHAKAPQCFRLCDIWACHQKALSDKLYNVIDSATLMNHYGFELYTVQGTHENIKITTPSDFYVFRALYEAKKNSQIFGLE
jgi:2-C-methyl-D-erythritol 4-phosphate cytidylyltransferase